MLADGKGGISKLISGFAATGAIVLTIKDNPVIGEKIQFLHTFLNFLQIPVENLS